jgi:fructosamine-3-kinase
MSPDSLTRLLRSEGLIAGEKVRLQGVSGGDINDAWRCDAGGQRLFLKSGPAARFDMFLAEAEGLRELQSADAVRVPRVIACIADDDNACLVLEWLQLEHAGVAAARILGQRLATLHRCTASTFGWSRDNFIGTTPQPNPERDSWTEFFVESRIGFQLDLAYCNGFSRDLREPTKNLARVVEDILSGHRPSASLLHGDLWGGNWAACSGEPVIFDPAVYYGDRETDLAMTRLFGGFGEEFYAAYEATWPLPEGHAGRLPLYQLYHVLNHLNLFGGAYLGRALAIIRALPVR